eukprot:gnl/MRDRNA2_/MRDRNA2_159732_c0_seq1.p1 gnl/MRDRNA2_/MRDRNA2_159732_c0~~gnl/MRDRNA2_/MRDRNA2_159732_c0_seq1.p1  ORF type:complete len:465 (+),score=79.04 gnl/MRDRNA2_/MRDRNA2_159732_c0_seq1:88-1482(+)
MADFRSRHAASGGWRRAKHASVEHDQTSVSSRNEPACALQTLTGDVEWSLFDHGVLLLGAESSSASDYEKRAKALEHLLEQMLVECRSSDDTLRRVGTSARGRNLRALASSIQKFVKSYESFQLRRAHEQYSANHLTTQNRKAQSSLFPDHLVEDLQKWQRPAGSASACSRSSTNVRPAGFGGPWLPRSFNAPGCGESLSSSSPLSDGTECQNLLARLSTCREDRQRYFEQYLECRETLLESTRSEVGLAREGESSSAPATSRRSDAPDLSKSLNSSRRAITPRAPRTSLPTKPPKASPPSAKSGRPLRGPQQRSEKGWQKYWADLTEGDPIILMNGTGVAGSGPVPPLRPLQAWGPTESSRGMSSSPNDMQQILASPRSIPKAAQLPDGLGGSMREYMEERSYLEKQLCTWEDDILALCQQHEELAQNVAALEAKLECHRQLDNPTIELLVRLSSLMDEPKEQ